MSWFNSCSLGYLSLVLMFAFGGNVWAQTTSADGVVSKRKPEPAQGSAADKSGSLESEVQALVTKLVKGMRLSKDGSLTRVAVLPFETVSRTEEARHLGQVSAALLSVFPLMAPLIMAFFFRPYMVRALVHLGADALVGIFFGTAVELGVWIGDQVVWLTVNLAYSGIYVLSGTTTAAAAAADSIPAEFLETNTVAEQGPLQGAIAGALLSLAAALYVP